MKTRQPVRARRGALAPALAAAIAMTIAASAHAQEQASPPPGDDNAVELDGVVVTGSRIKRSQVEGPSPVTIVTSEDLQKQGFVTIHEALGTLTQSTGFVQNELITNGLRPTPTSSTCAALAPAGRWC